jgi:hypothetical protein
MHYYHRKSKLYEIKISLVEFFAGFLIFLVVALSCTFTFHPYEYLWKEVSKNYRRRITGVYCHKVVLVQRLLTDRPKRFRTSPRSDALHQAD